MRIFLDTANIEEIKQGVRLGVISGITTNPSLISQAGAKDYEAAIKQICSVIPGPVSTEVTVEGVDAMIEQARRISKWAPNVVVKVPSTAEGFEVISVLSKEGIKVNCTLCFSVNQALLAAAAGAAYISPFVGRLDDIGQDGMVLVQDIVEIYLNYPEIKTEVIAASIRHPQHCVQAAQIGAHIATMPLKVLQQMVQHPLTDIGNKRFLADFKSISK
jgi:transaldolase